MNKIHYAFGRDYLKSWDIKDALREVFQNYIDFGEYNITSRITDCGDYVSVKIENDYKPDSLEFLRLGNTTKDSGDFIGHHGEGLKAAFLIFTRENIAFNICTHKHILKGNFDISEEIGETFNIEYFENHNKSAWYSDKFVTNFQCPKDIYDEFIGSIINKDDIEYSNSYGDILKSNKGIGNIYSGNLFVCHIANLNYSYNIKPKHLELDRDRKAPRDFDIDWVTSQILEDYLKYKEQKDIPFPINYNARDHSYAGHITEDAIKNIKSVNVDGVRQYYDTTSKTVINNPRIKQTLDKHPKFKKEIKISQRTKLNNKIRDNRRKSATTLLKEFKKNHCGSNTDMIIDIDVIINKLKKK